MILNESKINNLMRLEEVVDNYLDLEFDYVWWNEMKQKIQEKKDYLFQNEELINKTDLIQLVKNDI